MQSKLINWPRIVTIIAEQDGVSKMEVMRLAGVGGNAAKLITQNYGVGEPSYSEGVLLLEQFKKATDGEGPPTKNLPEKCRCNSCSMSYPVENIYRVSNGIFKCDGCIKRIERAYSKKNYRGVAA